MEITEIMKIELETAGAIMPMEDLIAEGSLQPIQIQRKYGVTITDGEFSGNLIATGSRLALRSFVMDQEIGWGPMDVNEIPEYYPTLA